MRTTAPWNKSARDEHLQMAKDGVNFFCWFVLGWMSFWGLGGWGMVLFGRKLLEGMFFF